MRFQTLPPQDPRFSLVDINQAELSIIRLALYALGLRQSFLGTVSEREQANKLYGEIADPQ